MLSSGWISEKFLGVECTGKIGENKNLCMCRFVAELPSGWVFILFCVLLRMTEGVGSAMYFTATFTLVPEFYPNRVSTIMVIMSN